MKSLEIQNGQATHMLDVREGKQLAIAKLEDGRDFVVEPVGKQGDGARHMDEDQFADFTSFLKVSQTAERAAY
jgi:rhodanese-related sulfurtransferase